MDHLPSMKGRLILGSLRSMRVDISAHPLLGTPEAARHVFDLVTCEASVSLSSRENLRGNAPEKSGAGLPAPHCKVARRDYEDHRDCCDSVERGCVDSGSCSCRWRR